MDGWNTGFLFGAKPICKGDMLVSGSVNTLNIIFIIQAPSMSFTSPPCDSHLRRPSAVVQERYQTSLTSATIGPMSWSFLKVSICKYYNVYIYIYYNHMTFMTSNMTFTRVVNTITFVSSTVYFSFKYLYVHFSKFSEIQATRYGLLMLAARQWTFPRVTNTMKPYLSVSSKWATDPLLSRKNPGLYLRGILVIMVYENDAHKNWVLHSSQINQSLKIHLLVKWSNKNGKQLS